MRGIYWLYVVGPETGWPVKVGYTANMRNRLGNLQVGYWEPLAMYKSYPVISKSTAIKLERLVHKRLSESAMIGEWFNVFAEDAIKVVDEVISYEKYLQAPLKVLENLTESFCS